MDVVHSEPGHGITRITQPGFTCYSARAQDGPQETKQQPGTAGPGNMLGSCLVSFHFPWAILSTSTVDLYFVAILAPLGKKEKKKFKHDIDSRHANFGTIIFPLQEGLPADDGGLRHRERRDDTQPGDVCGLWR